MSLTFNFFFVTFYFAVCFFQDCEFAELSQNLIWVDSKQGWTDIKRHGVIRKRREKEENHKGDKKGN